MFWQSCDILRKHLLAADAEIAIAASCGDFCMYNKEYKKNYYQKNRELILKKVKKHNDENRIAKSIYDKKYYIKNYEVKSEYRKKYGIENHEIILQKNKKYHTQNRESINEHTRNRRKKDTQFRISLNLRTRLYGAVKNGHLGGSGIRDMGCSITELKMYLEGQFKDGMTWENWSIKGWHIDHKIPLAFFDLTNREQFLQAVHYSNLQPMWAKENWSKGAKINKKDASN